MFNLFKKKPKGLDSKQRAYEVFRIVGQTYDDWERETNKFLKEYPEYELERDKIIDEIQWIPYVSAIIGIYFASNYKQANETINSLIDILKEGEIDDQPMEDDQIKKIKNRLNGYLVRFNKGIIYRDSNNDKEQQIMQIITEAVFDCANEGIYYFTNKRKDILASFENTLTLETREPYGMLEMHVRETLMKYFMPFSKHFNNLGIA